MARFIGEREKGSRSQAVIVIVNSTDLLHLQEQGVARPPRKLGQRAGIQGRMSFQRRRFDVSWLDKRSVQQATARVDCQHPGYPAGCTSRPGAEAASAGDARRTPPVIRAQPSGLIRQHLFDRNNPSNLRSDGQARPLSPAVSDVTRQIGYDWTARFVRISPVARRAAARSPRALSARVWARSAGVA